ncbi:MAG: ATP-dependent 6-phosphofructokinase [Candidatus Latescibacterota bacterium]|nr:MAG: ATP-dependent 6-phosphofructokinase [Candidatus Latescibacterota bacterium]
MHEYFGVRDLGERRFPSPLPLSDIVGDGIGSFTSDETRVRAKIETGPGEDPRDDLFFQKAGPRKRIFFDPRETTAAIVTCGGLCPGTNNVIRALVLGLSLNYGVRRILGIRYGFEGLNPAVAAPPLTLVPDSVEFIHRRGGTMLGTSRGSQETGIVVDFLEKARIDILFCIGGDGTHRGAHAIAEETLRRGSSIAIVCVPKTIDNDISFVGRSFGYGTALEEARDVIDGAHMEAKGARNGIGLVKLMGREAGFIAAGATLASQEVNFTLIPEVPFLLDGPGGFLEALEKRMDRKGHAVIVVAEGAGQHLFSEEPVLRDESGNPRPRDIGVFLKDRIVSHFAAIGKPVTLKYIDPSYIIRSVPADSDDSFFCNALARHAAHAGMAGKTDVTIGYQHDIFVHVPIPLVLERKKRVSPEGRLWGAVLESTGQPATFGLPVAEDPGAALF